MARTTTLRPFTPDLITARLLERFWWYVDKSGECWLWRGGIKDNGYAMFSVQVAGTWVAISAHLVSIVIHTRTNIPDDLCGLHKCRNRSCVRYDSKHVYLGTYTQNNLDSVSDGTALIGERHPFAKLSDKDIERIFALRALGTNQSVLAEMFNVTQGHISSILNVKKRTHYVRS